MLMLMLMMMMMMSIMGSKRKGSVSLEPGSSGGGKEAAGNHTSPGTSGSGKSHETLETKNLKSLEIRDSKQQLQKLKAALEEEKSQILKEQMQLKVTKAERNELMALQVKLKEEINILRAQQQKLLKETDALDQEKQTLEKEWDILDEKKKQLRQEFVAFERSRQHQEAKLFAKVKREQDNLLRDIELMRSEMEVSLEKRREELEKEFQEKEFKFQKKKDKELLYLSTQKELFQKGLEEISSKKRHLKRKRKDIATNIESIRAVVEEAKEFLDKSLDESDNDRRDVKESGEDAQAHSLDKYDTQLTGKRLSSERAVDEREESGAWDKRRVNPRKKRQCNDRSSLSSTNKCDINAAKTKQRCSPGIHKKKRQQHSTNSPISEDNKGKGRRYNFRDATIAAMNSSKKGFKEYRCQNGHKQDSETQLASTHDEVVLERFCYGKRKVQERNSQMHAESDNEGYMSQQELLLSEEEVYTDSRIEDKGENDAESCEGTKLEDENELEPQSLKEKIWKFLTT